MSIGFWRKPLVEGLNLAAPVFIDNDTTQELVRRKNSYGIKMWAAFQRHFSLGVRSEPVPFDETQAQIFAEKPKNIRAIVATEREYKFVYDLAENYFQKDMAMAAGWLIHYSLFNQSADPGEREQKITVVRPRVAAVVTNNKEQIVVPENVPTRQDLVGFRSKLSISQRQLAVEIGMSRGLLADIELGRSSHSSDALRFRLFLGLQKAAESRGVTL